MPFSRLAVLSKTGCCGKPVPVCVAVWLRVCDGVWVLDAVRVPLGVAVFDFVCVRVWVTLAVCVWLGVLVAVWLRLWD